MQIAYEQTNVPEKWDVEVQNFDSGTYVLNFVDTSVNPPSFYTTGTIKADASASDFRNAVNAFYWAKHRCSVSVVRTMYDSTGILTTASANATTYLYTVTVLEQMSGFSTSGVQAQAKADSKKKTSATSARVSVTPPSRAQASSSPFRGTYTVTCTDSFGAQHTSMEINYNESNDYKRRKLMTIPMLNEKIQIISDYRYDYTSNGISYMILFDGLDYDPPLCKIQPSSGTSPLSGNHDMQGNVTMIRHYGESLFFPVVPMEMLRTDAMNP